ncbi:MAG: carbohydrate kinase family protein [Patescibacteria group bacterium]
MYDIITIGSATRDVFLVTDQYRVVSSNDFSSGQGICLGLGSKLNVDKLIFSCGGGGANAAVTFARQGFKTASIGVVGNDLNGIELIHALEKEGIDTSHFQQHSHDFTGYSSILVGPKGERTILSYKGEGHHFNANSVPLEELQTKWLYLDSLGGNFELLERAVTWAVKNGVQLATNPGVRELQHGREKLAPLLRSFKIVAMNQEEASLLTGIEFNKEEELFKALNDLVDGIVIMTQGERGVMVSDGEKTYRAGIPKEAPQVERTGAGDAFNSAFVAQYARTPDDIQKCIQLGIANATSVVSQYGAMSGILKKDDHGMWPPVEILVV